MKVITIRKKLTKKQFLSIHNAAQHSLASQAAKEWHNELYQLYKQNKFDEVFCHFGDIGKFPLFLIIHEELDDLTYFRILGDVLTWETYASDEKEIIWYLINHPDRDKSLRNELMGNEEKEVYKNLPETGLIYRGDRYGMEAGFSWTLDKETAHFFASRRSKDGVILKGTYRKSDVIAYFSRESEIFIDPSRVIDPIIDEKVEPMKQGPNYKKGMYESALNFIRRSPPFISLKTNAYKFVGKNITLEDCLLK